MKTLEHKGKRGQLNEADPRLKENQVPLGDKGRVRRRGGVKEVISKASSRDVVALHAGGSIVASRHKKIEKGASVWGDWSNNDLG